MAKDADCAADVMSRNGHGWWWSWRNYGKTSQSALLPHHDWWKPIMLNITITFITPEAAWCTMYIHTKC